LTPKGAVEGPLDPGHTRSRSASPGPALRLHWRSLGDGILVSFLIAGPSLLAGFILRDQREGLWSAMLVIAALGFLAGGAIAGRHRRAARGALTQGVVLALLTATIIVLANMIRTAVLGHGMTSHTLELWAGVEVGAMVVAGIGGLIGRRSYIRARSRKSSPN
jgi:hypothetical protein